MSWWTRPLKEIKVNLQIIGSKHRNADDADTLAIWCHVEDMLAMHDQLEGALKVKDDMNGVKKQE